MEMQMNRLEVFKDNYEQSMQTIERLRTEPSTMKDLVNWMLTTDANPYAYLPEGWASAMESADSFAALLHNIHHAVYDDGDITFVTVNGEPRIVFVWQHEDNFRDYVLTRQEKELEKREVFGRTRPYDIQVLKIEPHEFGPAYDAYQIEDLKNCFAVDAGRNGIDFAVEHYSKYNCYDPSWVDECASEITKWANFYDRTQHG